MMEARLYWKTSNPKVLEAMRAEAERWKAFVAQMHEFNREYGVHAVHGRNPFDGSYICIGIKGDPSKLPGQWRKPDRANEIIRPYRNDKVSRGLIEQLNYETGRLPGMPRAVSEGELKITNRFTVAFQANGIAWATTGIGRPTFDGELPVDTTVWEPVSEAEYLQAVQEKEDNNGED
ncbi:hypothetical protein [Bifidobacterium callitrichidarum]|uniref:Uncharacterized protein n=1 Tax=Bifidobacterium callitrichidarum TaxID=2052941 RepID=A0A2U2MZ57_9BIFI|nr:hypothetical protein [Bifidobacterium callitrichidarum]PWG62087.1 hypothetical protein DF196_12735 [Bifidobacterium callitrichidarum]